MRSWLFAALVTLPRFAWADADSDGYDAPADCDDGNPAIHPGASEPCDDIDNDCNGTVDDQETRWYADRDYDKYGVTDDYVDACPTDQLPSLGGSGWWVTRGGDCDDTNETVSPGRFEFCDGLDNDCNGEVDDMSSTTIWHIDHDHDGFGRPGTSGSAQGTCPPNNDYTSWSVLSTDCDDGDDSVYPPITEADWINPNLWGVGPEGGVFGEVEVLADGIDQDCDGVDVCYFDHDGDGYGEDASTFTFDDDLDCGNGSLSYTANNGDDCDNEDALIHPGAAEIAGDNIDQDCDGHDVCYVDADGDGFGKDDPVPSTGAFCAEDTVAIAGDCDDKRATGADVHPGATEVCDGLDNNCDGFADENGVCPGEPAGCEGCNGSGPLSRTGAVLPFLLALLARRRPRSVTRPGQ